MIETFITVTIIFLLALGLTIYFHVKSDNQTAAVALLAAIISGVILLSLSLSIIVYRQECNYLINDRETLIQYVNAVNLDKQTEIINREISTYNKILAKHQTDIIQNNFIISKYNEQIIALGPLEEKK